VLREVDPGMEDGLQDALDLLEGVAQSLVTGVCPWVSA
jgi:hypothetical protein